MQLHLIDTNASLLDALGKLNALSGKVMTLFAIDSDGVMRGTITDGDLRRALLDGATLDSKVSDAMHHNFKALRSGHPDVALLRECRKNGIKLLPCLNQAGKIDKILDLSQINTLLPLGAIVMAGGKGERLRPLTLDTPKPLLKVGGKAIIDYNIEALARCGITDITVSVKYLADKMRQHFAQGNPALPPETKITCVEEDMPMGTIGAAALAEIPDEGYTLVMNSDLLTTINYEDMYLHHMQQKADVTIAAVPYQVSVPFAILDISDDDPAKVTGLQEKPSFSHFANAGIYIFSNKLLKTLPRDQRTDATDLIESAIAQGLRVTYFPINGTWIDIGAPADYRQACELMSMKFS